MACNVQRYIQYVDIESQFVFSYTCSSVWFGSGKNGPCRTPTCSICFLGPCCVNINEEKVNICASRPQEINIKALIIPTGKSPGRCILIKCDIHRPLWLVSVYEELKWLGGGTLSSHPFPKSYTFLYRYGMTQSCQLLPIWGWGWGWSVKARVWVRVWGYEDEIFAILEYVEMTRNRILRDCGSEGDAGMCNFWE